MGQARPWFRFYTEVLEDRRFFEMSAELYRRWTMLLCLTGRHGGTLPLVADIAFALRITVAEAKATLDTLADTYGLIDRDEQHQAPHNWQGRQFESDISTPRVQKYRSGQLGNVPETLHATPHGNGERNVSVTLPETPPESDTESDTESESLLVIDMTDTDPPDAHALANGHLADPLPVDATGRPPPWPDAPWIDQAFEQSFWAPYPRKTHKQPAKMAYRNLMRAQPTFEAAYALAATITEALCEQAEHWTDPEYTPHPAGYLKARRWEDEHIIPTGHHARRR